MTRRIYLDYASLTPVDPKIKKLMLAYADAANPSSLYQEGGVAKQAVKESRRRIAELLNIKPEEVVFTASGTESDNLALLGIFNFWKKKLTPHIITTTIEHPGILETCKYIEKNGGEVSYIPVEENGIVDPQKIAQALKENTVLVSVMYANNEIGTIQPLREISRMIAEFRKNKKPAVDQNRIGPDLTQPLLRTESELVLLPYFHTDASQAANYLDLSFQKLGVDMMTLDGAKMYGPRGMGILGVRRHVALEPIIFGGGQERGIRSGTENVASIVGIAEALTQTQNMKEKESERLNKLKEYFFEIVIKSIPSVIINGDREKRLPNNVNICIPSLDAEFAVIQLDREGIACSAASACQSLSEEPYSYVINALGSQAEVCRGSSLRFTFGRATTQRELELTLTKILSIIQKQ